MLQRDGGSSHLWTTVARVAVCVMFGGAAADLAGWKVGFYMSGGAFLVLMLSLQYP